MELTLSKPLLVIMTAPLLPPAGGSDSLPWACCGPPPSCPLVVSGPAGGHRDMGEGVAEKRGTLSGEGMGGSPHPPNQSQFALVSDNLERLAIIRGGGIGNGSQELFP